MLELPSAALFSVSADGHDPTVAVLAAYDPGGPEGFDADSRRQVVGRLFVPRFRPAAPVRTVTEHRCRGANANATAWSSASPSSKTGGTTCAAGARLFRAVAPRLRIQGYEHLGLRRPTRTARYACRVSLTGVSPWRISCRRGSRLVVGFTAN